jgi:hypothetical protein
MPIIMLRVVGSQINLTSSRRCRMPRSRHMSVSASKWWVVAAGKALPSIVQPFRWMASLPWSRWIWIIGTMDSRAATKSIRLWWGAKLMSPTSAWKKRKSTWACPTLFANKCGNKKKLKASKNLTKSLPRSIRFSKSSQWQVLMI